MNRTDRLLAKCVTAALACACVTDGARSSDGYAEVDGTARAKSFLVLKVTFYADVELGDVSLEISFDGETFFTALLGLPRPDRLFKSISRGSEGTTVLVPAVAGFAVGDPQFFIQEGGTYWVKWGAKSKREGDFRELEVRQTIHAERASQSDLAFLERISDPDLLRHLFGEDFFDRQTDTVRERMLAPSGADYRALKVIARLLEATRADDPGEVVRPRGGIESALKWADALLPLAKEFPESSYAPYAAYYAGCCYLAAGGDVLEKTMKERGIEDSALTAKKLQALAAEPEAALHCGKAEEALSLAANHADLYLKPRAVYMQAALLGMRGQWDEMERLLDKALAEAPGEGTIQQLVDRARRGLAKAKERQQQEEGAAKED